LSSAIPTSGPALAIERPRDVETDADTCDTQRSLAAERTAARTAAPAGRRPRGEVRRGPTPPDEMARIS
jgi:hypothetical protein